MAHITIRQEPGSYLHAKALTVTKGRKFTFLDIHRGDDSLTIDFEHSEEGVEQLHKLLVGVMDAFRLVDEAVQRQKHEVVPEVEVAA